MLACTTYITITAITASDLIYTNYTVHLLMLRFMLNIIELFKKNLILIIRKYY